MEYFTNLDFSENSRILLLFATILQGRNPWCNIAIDCISATWKPGLRRTWIKSLPPRIRIPRNIFRISMVFTGFHRFKGSQQKISQNVRMMFLNSAPLLTLWDKMSQPYFLKRCIHTYSYHQLCHKKTQTKHPSISPFLDLSAFLKRKTS